MTDLRHTIRDALLEQINGLEKPLNHNQVEALIDIYTNEDTFRVITSLLATLMAINPDYFRRVLEHAGQIMKKNIEVHFKEPLEEMKTPPKVM